MIGESFMSRANTIVVPGGKMDLAMQLILTPMILRLMEIRRASCTDGRRRNTMLRLLTFDLDGTLVDTAAEIAQAVHLTFDDFALARRSEDEIIGQIGGARAS
jgi:hypothetical protein